MKKITLALFILLAAPSLVMGSNAAPYTEEAWQDIIKATQEIPKAKYDDTISREKSLEQMVDYYSKVFDKAGYSFNDTVKQIIDDLQNNPEVIPNDHQSVYNNLYILLNLMLFECQFGKIDLMQFFPADMEAELSWFAENSQFGGHQDMMYHGIKKKE